MHRLFLLSLFITGATAAYSQFASDSILIEGHYRSFHYKQPVGDIKNHVIIFIMHGSGGNGLQMTEPAKHLQTEAEGMAFFLVYPDGYKNYWNECRKNATSLANKEDINEQAFFSAMLHYFQTKYTTDGSRFFAIGLSGGGHMAYKLAMTMPVQCKGITAVVANVPDTMNLDCVEAHKAVAVMIANGTKDPLNKYDGGDIIINGDNWGAIRSTDRSFHYWSSLAGYNGEPVKDELSDPDPANGQTITRYSYRDKNKPAVVLLKVNGGEHAFPKDVDIFIEAGKFFKEEENRLKK
ncbi:MAG: poly(3-hydroxybutyrate) depolymerase [Chitinophagaceae bacterium]